MAETAAVMKHVGIGNRGDDEPVLWFDAYVSEGLASLQIIPWDEAYHVMKQVGNLRDLEGHACWVELDEARRSMRFLRLWGKLP